MDAKADGSVEDELAIYKRGCRAFWLQEEGIRDHVENVKVWNDSLS